MKVQANNVEPRFQDVRNFLPILILAALSRRLMWKLPSAFVQLHSMLLHPRDVMCTQRLKWSLLVGLWDMCACGISACGLRETLLEGMRKTTDSGSRSI